jgi:hypothetical protein
MLADWIHHGQDFVNYRLQGLSFEDILKVSTHAKYFDVHNPKNKYFTYVYRSASRLYWEKTSFWKELTDMQQRIILEWIDEWDFGEATLRTIHIQKTQEAFQKRKELLKTHFGKKFVASNVITIDGEEYLNTNAETFLVLYYKTVHKRQDGIFNMFTYAQMEKILDRAIGQFLTLFSKGIQLDSPVFLYRGIREAPTPRDQFIATSVSKLEAAEYSKGTFLVYVLKPGVPFFVFGEKEEVVLPYTLSFDGSEPQTMRLYMPFENEDYYSEFGDFGKPKLVQTYVYETSLVGGSKKRRTTKSKRSVRKRSKKRSNHSRRFKTRSQLYI